MNNDYKYVMHDMTNIYIGAKYTYDEIMDNDDVPFKFKTILSRYILKEVAGNTTLENHIFYMKKGYYSEISESLKRSFLTR